MESQSSLIRTQSRVKLYSVTSVDLRFVLVIFPDNTELNYTFGNGNNLEGGFEFRVGLEEGAVFEGRDEF